MQRVSFAYSWIVENWIGWVHVCIRSRRSARATVTRPPWKCTNESANTNAVFTHTVYEMFVYTALCVPDLEFTVNGDRFLETTAAKCKLWNAIHLAFQYTAWGVSELWAGASSGSSSLWKVSGRSSRSIRSTFNRVGLVKQRIISRNNFYSWKVFRLSTFRHDTGCVRRFSPLFLPALTEDANTLASEVWDTSARCAIKSFRAVYN